MVEKHREENVSTPGFARCPTFTLKRVESADEPAIPVVIESPRDVEISSVPTSFDLNDTSAIKTSLKFQHRPWIINGEFQTEGESEAKQHDMRVLSKGCLPKGVVRGCEECSDCQKVSARWAPEGACSYSLDEAPVFRPHEEEFKDTLKYIDSIRQQVEPYGLCRIIPPPSWKPPCFLEEDDIWQSCKFSTQIQRINELQNHDSSQKASIHETGDAKRRRLDYEVGDGCAANFISNELHGEDSQFESGPHFTLLTFRRYADYFKQQYFSRDASMSDSKVSPVTSPKNWEPSELDIEGEYWRIVEKPTEEIEVCKQYIMLGCIFYIQVIVRMYGQVVGLWFCLFQVLSAADMDHRTFGCRFPVIANPEEVSDNAENHMTAWNLNCVSRLPGSLLSSDTMNSFSHFAPRMHVGMCFSSLPWTVGEHRLYKLHYLHMGAPKIWYGTSGGDSFKFEAVQKGQSLNSCREHPELCCSMGRQLSPATLKSEDVPVYHCIQRPGEFVLFLPSAYHSGFDCGFNFSVSACFASLDWLPHGLISVELYREQRRKTSISLDRMLLRAADQAVKAWWEHLLKGKTNTVWKKACGKDGILAKVITMRTRSESISKEYLSSASQSRKMDKSFDDGDKKRECSTCYCDLYLSAASCPCNPNKFSCLRHSKDLCSCPWSDKIFLFRYLNSELKILAEALEGRVTCARDWVKEDLGRALYQDNPDKTQNGPTQNPSSSCVKGRTVPSEEDKTAAMKLLGEQPSMGDRKGKKIATASTLSDSSDESSSSSSSELDIEACVARLKALKQKLCPSQNEGESGSKQTTESETQNALSGLKQTTDGGVTNVPKPATEEPSDKENQGQMDSIICLSDDDN